MPIYGTALLGICHLLGIVLGDLLGNLLGVNTNVGGVGIAMILLISVRIFLHSQGKLNEASEQGVHYWGALYIPVVVAMAMQQNVVAALKGGPIAILAAVGSVLACYFCVSAINRGEPEQSEGTFANPSAEINPRKP
jgi:malonate transporter MadL subunit